MRPTKPAGGLVRKYQSRPRQELREWWLTILMCLDFVIIPLTRRS